VDGQLVDSQVLPDTRIGNQKFWITIEQFRTVQVARFKLSRNLGQ